MLPSGGNDVLNPYSRSTAKGLRICPVGRPTGKWDHQWRSLTLDRMSENLTFPCDVRHVNFSLLRFNQCATVAQAVCTCARYISLKTRLMPRKQASPLSAEFAKRFPIRGPSAEQIRRLKEQGPSRGVRNLLVTLIGLFAADAHCELVDFGLLAI